MINDPNGGAQGHQTPLQTAVATDDGRDPDAQREVRIAAEKAAIRRHPITAPTTTAMKTVSLLIPTSRPAIPVMPGYRG
jgi:hypothetical protein